MEITGLKRIDGLGLQSCHYTGAASEHYAAAYYLNKEYQVYWPSCQQSNIDFVVEKHGVFKKVQVKTATWNKAGPYYYLQCRTRTGNTSPEHHMFDVLFVVHETSAWEIPGEAIDTTNLSLKGTHPDYGGTRWDDYQVI